LSAAVAGTTSFRPPPSYTTLWDVTDLVQTLQTLCGSDALRIACKQAASRELGQLGKAAIVRSLSADADAPADCAHEKDLQMQVFSRAADGIRTHDLLHGNQ
jgi:hypothetical protein